MILTFGERQESQSRCRYIRTSSCWNELTWERELEPHFPYRLTVALKPLGRLFQSFT